MSAHIDTTTPTWRYDFYHSREWREIRPIVLSRDHHECQDCRRAGRYSRGTTVHHILRLEDRPDLALTLDNLVTLCATCHNREHPDKLPESRQAIRRRELAPEKW